MPFLVISPLGHRGYGSHKSREQITSLEHETLNLIYTSIAKNIYDYIGGTFSNAPIRKSIAQNGWTSSIHSQINVLIKFLHFFAETDRKKSQYLGHQLRKLEQT